jgi:hypothetical protein
MLFKRFCVIVIVLFMTSSVRLAWAEDALLDELTRPSEGVSKRASSANEDLSRNGDSRSIEPGATLVLGDLEGPGVITHMWFTVSSSDVFYGRSLVLRIYWDGADKPSVEAPLGDFFGLGHGALFTYSSAPACVTSNGRAMSCFWRMPFKKNARVTVTNESEKYKCDSLYYYVDWRKAPQPDDSLYFHARYRQATPAQPGDYTILETSGRGHYVGVVYSVHQMENGWFGEGDDRFYIDGETTPSLSGTGTEDYFCDAWGFRAFATPYYGVPLFEGYHAGDRLTAYRWHIADPVVFTKSLKATIEHKGSVFNDSLGDLGGFEERGDWISSVAFWFQSPPTVSCEPLPPLAQRLPPYKVLSAEALPVKADPPMLVLKQNGGVMYLPASPTASIEFEFEALEKGRYSLQAIMSFAMLGGVYQPVLDGQAFGAPLDLCSEGMDHNLVNLDLHELESGKHVLRFEGRGSSPHMRALTRPVYGFGLENLILLRLDDMQGYKTVTNRLMEERSGIRQK